MSFFTKFFLYFIPLIAIPVIIHLLGKSRIKTVEFSTLKFLTKLKKDAIRKLKLRQLILLIIRTLLVLLIILFFARPYIMTGSKNIYPEKGDLLILLVDNSHSTGEQFRDRTLLENKISEIMELAEFIDYPIAVKIKLTTRPQDIIDYGKIDNIEAFQKILSEIETTSAESRMLQSLAELQNSMENDNIHNATLWIISDFQDRENFQENLAVNFSTLMARTTLFPIRHQGINNAFREVVFPNQIIEVNKNILLQAFISFWQDYRETKVSLFIDNKRVAQDITKEPGKSVNFEFAPLKTGPLNGYLALPNDNHSLDNKYYFALKIPEQVNLLIISNQVRSNMLERALTAGKETLFRIQSISPEILAMENLAEYDVLLFHNVTQLPGAYKDKLNDFLDRGQGIIYIPGVNSSIAEYNDFWHRAMELPRWNTNIFGSSGSYMKIKNINSAHPIFSRIWQSENRFESSAQFFTIPDMERDKTAQILIDYSNGKPLLTEIADRRMLLLSAFVTPGESNLQLSGFFPVLMQQMVLYLSNFDKSMVNYSVGDTLQHSVFELENINDFSMRTPDNRSYLMDYIEKDGTLIFDKTNLPGFYKLYQKGKTIREFAVNISKNEAGGNFMTVADLTDITENNEKIAIYSNDNEQGPKQTNKEINGLILILVILLLLAETLIARINRNN